MLNNILNDSAVEQFYRMISEADKIVLTCHVRPDGDAIGSTLGLYHLLTALGKQPKVITPDTLPKSLNFMPGSKDVVPYTKYHDFCNKLIDEASLIICCDFNKLHRIDQLADVIGNARAKKILIDHHQDPDKFCDLIFSYPDMSSTCELLFRIIAAAGLLEYVDEQCATDIATGIITDTRNLSVNCDNPELYMIMYHLLKYGINKQRILREALETKSLDSMRLQAFAIAERMKIYPRHRAALIYLDEEDLQRFHYEKGDTEGLVNEPLKIPEIVYSIFLRQDPNCIKVSTRSKDRFPVSRICEEHFGGGGHLQAAGGEFHGTMQECIELVEKILPDYDTLLP